MNLKTNVKNLLGKKNLGRLDYFTKAEYKHIWGGAFNGQLFRREIFDQLCVFNDFRLVVETGSYRGNTTSYMAKKSIPILTVELGERIFGYVSMRFLLNTRVRTFNGDSRTFLKNLANDRGVAKENVFFYLDAHWHDDLPLAEELSTIFAGFKNWVVMIDDFQVPNTAYQFDSYGEGKALTLDYISKALPEETYWVYFPSVDETKETGSRRGCAILCNSEMVHGQLARCDTLRLWAKV